MSQMRTRIAERLKESQNTAAMLTTFQEVYLFWFVVFEFIVDFLLV